MPEKLFGAPRISLWIAVSPLLHGSSDVAQLHTSHLPFHRAEQTGATIAYLLLESEIPRQFDRQTQGGFCIIDSK